MPRVARVVRPRLSEAQFLRQIQAAAQLLGYHCHHHWLSIHSAPGYPDLTLVREGRLLFIEAKTYLGRLTVHQEQWLDWLNHSAPGVEARVVRPKDWDTLMAWLKEGTPFE